jgi:acetoin utilization deacetylase AcuC-like enzyme
MPSQTAILVDPIYKQHDTGAGHPERAERLDAVLSALERTGALKDAVRVPLRDATEDELALCHERKYIGIVRHDVESGLHTMSTGDTQISAKSYDIALKAAGGVLNAVDAVFGKKARNAFCAVRPPGHHATPNKGMGFCLFNNVAIAARYAQKKYGVGNVLIVDWDVHHGNGTQDIFYSDGSVFYFSTHQWPWYPGTGSAGETGEGKGKGTTLNVPCPAGSGKIQVVGAFQKALVPIMDNYKPELTLISTGFDSRMGDPLGRFTLSDADFTDLTAIMMEIAGKHSGGRLLSVLEGGYSLSGLASGVAAHVERLRE